MKSQTGYLIILILFFFYFLISGAIPLLKQELEKVWKKRDRIERIEENIISVEVKVFGLQKTWKVEGFRNNNDIQYKSDACLSQFSTHQTQPECKGK